MKKVVKFFFEKFGFEKHFKSWMYISYHKNKFPNGSTKKFSKISKIYVSLGFNWSSLFFNWLKREEENLVFILKSRVSFIPSQFLLISHVHFVPTQFLSTNFHHASFKHDSHTLISKFYGFYFFFFEIRVFMFLRDLGILWNWVKLVKIDLCYWSIEWL